MLSILLSEWFSFRVSLTLIWGSGCRTAKASSKKRSEGAWESDEEQSGAARGSEPLMLSKSILEANRMKLVKDYILEQIMSWFPTSESQIPDWFQKFESLLLRKFYGLWWDWRKLKESDDDINYDQVPCS